MTDNSDGFWGDFGVSLIIAVVYALVLWGTYTLLGAPDYSDHDLTDVIIDLAVVFGIAYFFGIRAGRRRP